MEIYALKLPGKLDLLTTKILLNTVNANKRNRLEKYVFWQDMQRSLFADLMVRKAIIQEFNIANEHIVFKENHYGKPYCENINNFHFNVSHSGDWIVCATGNNPMGIDIEEISTIDLDISKNYFSGKEHEDLILSNDPFDYFFTLWSLKESYIKYIGKGLSHPLNSFSMRFVNNSIQIESQDKILENTFFRQYNIDRGYKMAVCTNHNKIPENVTFCNAGEIVDLFTVMEKQNSA